MCNKNNSVFYFIVLSLLFLHACKKDKDITGPTVEINTPIDNQTFNVLDVIIVSGAVSDDTKITSVTVSLVDAQQHVAHVSVSASVTSPTMSYSVQYPLDNIHLESGTYYILVTASDGANDTRKYCKINLIAVPRVLTKLFVVSNTTSSQTNWGYIDNSFSSIVPFTTFTGDYIGSATSSYYQQLFNCGNYTGNYSSYDLTTNLLKYTISGNTSSNPYFTGYTTAINNTFVARYDEYIKGYNYKGDPTYTAQAMSGCFAKHIIFNGGVLIAEQQNKITLAKILVTYYATGVADVQTNLTQDVAALVEKDNTNVFVFGNVSGQGIIQLFDRINNNLWSPYPFSLPLGSILSAVKINDDTYLIGHSNGTILKYQYQTSSLTTYLTGYTAKQLKYDSDANKIYVVENNKITSLDYASASIVNTVTSGENILDLQLLYNR